MNRFLPLFCFLCCTSLSAQIIYVAPSGVGDGSTWSQATSNLRNAINNAPAGSQVWVAAGTYTPTTCSPCGDSDRMLYFEIPNNVAVYGGFTGSENNLNERNWQAHATILSGDIDADGTLDNNAYSVVYTHNVTESAILDGFYIRHGNADDPNGPADGPTTCGGGWYNDGGVSPNFAYPTGRNLVFEENFASSRGGAVYNDANFGGNAQPIFENVQFFLNTADQNGGAVYTDASFNGFGKPVYRNCSFENNQTTVGNGGAVYNLGTENGECLSTYEDCIFTGNIAVEVGGAVMNNGQGGNASPEFMRCDFTSNTALQGGAIYNNGFFSGICNPSFDSVLFEANHAIIDGGGVFNAGFSGQVNPQFNHCRFMANTSGGAGAGMFSNGIEGVSNPVLNYCWFEGNVAQTYGAGMYNNGKSGDCSPVLNNCVFYKNTAVSSAGAIYNLGSEGGNSSPVLTNCTIYGNWAVVGGAIYNNANDDQGTAAVAVINCIIYNNVSPNGNVFRNIYGTPTISYSLIDTTDCAASNAGFGGFTTCGDGMQYDVVPQFVDAENGDLRLLATSPAVDAGDNLATTNAGILLDFTGHARVSNNTVDLGAFEFEDNTYTPPLIVEQPQNQAVCPGESVGFSVGVNHPDPVEYQWQKNEVDIPGATAAQYSIASVDSDDAGSYRARITGSGGDVQFTLAANLDVSTAITPEVSITASTLAACSGETILFSSNFTGSGANPEFQWSINGNNFGGSISGFSIDNLSDGDQIQLVATSSLTCVTSTTANSNILTVSITPTVLPEVTVLPQQMDPQCPGTPLGFVADALHAGDDPVYIWYVNGTPQGDNEPQFGSNGLLNGDLVTVELQSSLSCAESDSVISEEYSISALPNLVPTAQLVPASDTAICPGESVFFELMVSNEGDAPVYEWFVDGTLVTGANGATFEAVEPMDGTEIFAQLTSSALCALPAEILTETFTVEQKDCSVTTADLQLDARVQVFPVPVRETLHLHNTSELRFHDYQLRDASGRLVATNVFQTEISVAQLPAGIYTLRLRADEGVFSRRIVVLR